MDVQLQFRGRLYRVDFDREEDGRYIAEIPDLPGVLAYGTSQRESLKRILKILTEREG